MFSLPSIPTDNLYKFCFVSGVILYVLAGFTYYNTTILSLKNHSLREKITAEEFRDSVVKAEFIRFDPINNESAEIIDVEKAKARAVKNTDSIMSQELAIIKDKSTITSYLSYTIYITLVGSILILFGGKMWFHAVQKPQDVLLKIQLELANIELKVALIELRALEARQPTNDSIIIDPPSVELPSEE